MNNWTKPNHKVRYENGKMLHPIEIISKTKWDIWQEIIWNRKIAGNIRGWRFWQVDERIYWLVKGKPKELKPQHAKLTSVWEIRVPLCMDKCSMHTHLEGEPCRGFRNSSKQSLK